MQKEVGEPKSLINAEFSDYSQFKHTDTSISHT